MDRIAPGRALFLGLAALQDLADGARRGPIAPSLQLRALLALLALQANGDLSGYKAFWASCQRRPKPGEHEGAQNYERGLYADIALSEIARSVGIDTRDRAFTDALWRILEPHGAARQPGDADRRQPRPSEHRLNQDRPE